jgi:DNA polymerase III epsilon subunit-like protein
VFDVETTGLMPKPKISVKRNETGRPNETGLLNETGRLIICDYPYITQLSFVIYDLVDCKIVQTFDSYISVPDTVTISEEVSALTGITCELCQQKGRPIADVLLELFAAYQNCDGIVAHNIDFDVKMILIEIERNVETLVEKNMRCLSLFQPIYEELHGIERYCTMRKGTPLCNIVTATESDGSETEVKEKSSRYAPRKKWPKLAELYATLFDGEVPEGLHNALVDVKACLRCYLKMRHNSSAVF